MHLGGDHEVVDGAEGMVGVGRPERVAGADQQRPHAVVAASLPLQPVLDGTPPACRQGVDGESGCVTQGARSGFLESQDPHWQPSPAHQGRCHLGAFVDGDRCRFDATLTAHVQLGGGDQHHSEHGKEHQQHPDPCQVRLPHPQRCDGDDDAADEEDPASRRDAEGDARWVGGCA